VLRSAGAIKEALAQSKTPIGQPQQSDAQTSLDFDTTKIDQVLGVKGKPNGGVYQVTVERGDAITEAGMPLNPAGPLGLATKINFQPTPAMAKLQLRATLFY
jgi:Domain of Unknown Function (DUF1259)